MKKDHFRSGVESLLHFYWCFCSVLIYKMRCVKHILFKVSASVKPAVKGSREEHQSQKLIWRSRSIHFLALLLTLSEAFCFRKKKINMTHNADSSWQEYSSTVLYRFLIFIVPSYFEWLFSSAWCFCDCQGYADWGLFFFFLRTRQRKVEGQSWEAVAQQRPWNVRRRQRDRQVDKKREGVLGEAAELTVDNLSSEDRKADRGTWDTSVGLPELMRESIFSASLLQASIWGYTPGKRSV